MTAPRTGTSWGRVVALGLLLVVVVGCSTPRTEVAAGLSSAPADYRAGALVPVPFPMPDTTLTDTRGRSYNVRTSPSKPVTLVFFGYTHCPDVCTDVLSNVALALSRMDTGSRDQVELLYITTDPARDSAAVVGRYLSRFDPSFVGLTGDLPRIRSLAEQVGVDIEGLRRLPDGGYEVGHSAQVTGFDRQRRGVVQWAPATPVTDLCQDVELMVARQR